MIKILILGQFDYQTFPIVEGMVEVKKTDLELIGISKCFDVENQCIIDWQPEPEGE